jgi:hypothetical protein
VHEEASSVKPNKSVLGFLVEQAVLSTIATKGIMIEGKLQLFPETFWFGSETLATQSPITEPTMFLPTIFNYPDVNAILAIPKSKNQATAIRVGVQVTLGTYASHSASAGKFMVAENCTSWIHPSTEDKDYTWYFLWIMPRFRLQPNAIPHARELHSTRGKAGQTKVVGYTELFYAIGDVNGELSVVDSK